MLIALDTETTGVDLHHGAKPFFVTTCDEKMEQRFWQWEVDPISRQPMVPKGDLEEIAELLSPNEAGEIVLHNSKFDVAALKTIRKEFGEYWRWDVTHDTLIAGHLLGSNLPHDLTSMAMQYLGVDIQPYEDALEEACLEARRFARSHYPNWRIAKKGLDDTPSAREKTWKFDTWLPRTIALQDGNTDKVDKGWLTVLSDYANVDSAITIQLHWVVQEEIRRRGLEQIYKERLKVLPIAHNMEQRGVTINRLRVNQLKTLYKEQSDKLGKTCVDLAKKLGHNLVLPKGGVNNSLREFVFGVLKLPPIYSRKARTASPTLDKAAMEVYESVLEPRSNGLIFIKSLRAKRKRDTSLAYMEGYERFWLPLSQVPTSKGVKSPLAKINGVQKSEAGTGEWFILHPSLNITGTDTLRWSSSNPNEQNISKQGLYEGDKMTLRFLLGPEPGREWYSCDAKNIELRLPAYDSEEKELIALFEKPDEPPYYGSTHLLNFSTVYPDIWEKELGTVCENCCKGKKVDLSMVGPHCKKKYASSWYQYCKNGGFCKQYGGQEKLTDQTFRRKGAFRLIESRFSKLADLNQRCIRFADKHGYIETIPDRSVDPSKGYPLLCTRSEYGRVKPTIPLNYRTQGSAMWWTMKAMIRCQQQLDEWRQQDGFDGYIVMQVHDEIVFSFPKRGNPVAELERLKANNGKATFRTSNLWRIRRLAQLMEKGGEDFGIPTPVGIEYHADNWSEGVTL